MGMSVPKFYCRPFLLILYEGWRGDDPMGRRRYAAPDRSFRLLQKTALAHV